MAVDPRKLARDEPDRDGRYEMPDVSDLNRVQPGSWLDDSETSSDPVEAAAALKYRLEREAWERAFNERLETLGPWLAASIRRARSPR